MYYDDYLDYYDEDYDYDDYDYDVYDEFDDYYDEDLDILEEAYLEGLFASLEDYDEESSDILLMEYLINEGYDFDEIFEEGLFDGLKTKMNKRTMDKARRKLLDMGVSDNDINQNSGSDYYVHSGTFINKDDLSRKDIYSKEKGKRTSNAYYDGSAGSFERNKQQNIYNQALRDMQKRDQRNMRKEQKKEIWNSMTTREKLAHDWRQTKRDMKKLGKSSAQAYDKAKTNLGNAYNTFNKNRINRSIDRQNRKLAKLQSKGYLKGHQPLNIRLQ